VKKIKTKFETAPLREVLKKIARHERSKGIVERVTFKAEPYAVGQNTHISH